MVACQCKECSGKVVNLLLFEEHSGSWERYRTGNMILSNYGVSLKVSSRRQSFSPEHCRLDVLIMYSCTSLH